jgi:predicted metallopeptidase
MVKYERACDVCSLVRLIVEAGFFPHVRLERVGCVRSFGSRSSAFARIYGAHRPWLLGLGCEPGYVIEVVSENFDRLPLRAKVEVVVHELLHIPRTFSGALRPHGSLVNDRRVREIADAVIEKLGVRRIEEALSSRC